MQFYNTLPTRGQPLSCDSCDWLDIGFLVFDDVITKNADISKNNDVMGQMTDEIEFTHGTLPSR